MIYRPAKHIAKELRKGKLYRQSAAVKVSDQKHAAIYERMRQDPSHAHESDEQIHHRAAYYLVWHSHGRRKPRWTKRIVFSAFLLLVILLAISRQAHCQIAGIQLQQGGGSKGTVAGGIARLNFSGCTVSEKSANSWNIICSGGPGGSGPNSDAGTANNFFNSYNADTLTFGKSRPSCATLSDSGSLCSSSASIPAAQVQTDWNAVSGMGQILNKPTIPAAQVQSDWNALSGMGQILNKPTIPAAQIQSDWNQSSSGLLDYIKNKPTLGSLAAKSSVDYSTTDITNKPTLAGTASAQSHKFLSAYNASTGTFTLAQPDYADLTGVPTDTVYAASAISITTGTLNSGTLSTIQTFNDGNVYDVQEVTGVPGFDIRIDFSGVASFNRIQLNLAYTNTSQHVVNIDLWNFTTSAWDTMTTFQGLNGYTQFTPGVINSTPFISAGVVHLRLYHVTTGYAGHSLQIDYATLQDAQQGSQGIEGPPGPTGPAGTTDYAQLTNKPTLGTAAAKDIPSSGNASATQVVYGSDTRLSDARTPSAHNQAETTITFTDVTTGNASTSNHGFFPKLPTPAGKYLKDDMTWAAISGGVPSGMIAFIKTGTCPAGWTEETTLSGYYILATKTANSDVGGTAAASVSLTAAAQSFTGDATTVPALAAGTLVHAHTHTITQSSFTTTKFTTNASGTAAYTGGGVVTTPSGAASSTAVTGSTATGTLTPNGHNASSAVTGTVTPAYIKMIPCSKD